MTNWNLYALFIAVFGIVGCVARLTMSEWWLTQWLALFPWQNWPRAFKNIGISGAQRRKLVAGKRGLLKAIISWRIYAINIGLSFVLTGCMRDVSGEPSYAFMELRGRCFTLKQDMFLTRTSGYAEYGMIAPGSDYSLPQSTQEYEQSGDASDGRIAGIAQAGVRVRPYQLVEDNWNPSSSLHVRATLLDGLFAGRTVEITYVLESPMGDNAGGGWQIDYRYMEPCP